MTRKQFEELRSEIEQQKFIFSGVSSVARYAVERAQFRKNQLTTLISAARTVPNSRTVEAKVVRWERQLQKLDDIPERFTRLFGSSEIQADSVLLR